MKRRGFIKGLAGAGIMMPGMFGLSGIRAFAQSPGHAPFRRLQSAREDRVMVVLRLFGGNDGLNTLVPYNDDRYYQVRGRGSDFDMSIPAETVGRISDSGMMGFHPAWEPIRRLYEERKVCVIQNVGYPEQNLSHFRSSDIWFSASDADVYDTSGWYARYLEEKYPDYPGLLPRDPYAIEFGTSLGITLVGRGNDMGITLSELDHIPEMPEDSDSAQTKAGNEERYLRSIERQTNTFYNSIVEAQKRAPANTIPYPSEGPLGASLATVARLVAAGLGTQLYIINIDGFDTHDGHIRRHAILLRYCAEAIYAFQRDLEGLGIDDRVAAMTVSEFGRRVIPNGSGTDHGAAAPLFVFGSEVNGGIIGHDPDVDDLDDAGNLKMEYDFRQIYASVLAQWFGASDSDIYPAVLPRPFAQLPVFTRPSRTEPERVAGLALGSCYPNPASVSTTIPVEGFAGGMDARLSLFTLEGRRVLRREVMAGEREVSLDLRGLPSGVYIYELAGGGSRLVGRVTVER